MGTAIENCHALFASIDVAQRMGAGKRGAMRRQYSKGETLEIVALEVGIGR